MKNEPKFKGVNFEPFNEYKSIGTQWIALYVNDDNVIYFNSFGVEHIPKEIKKFLVNITIDIKHRIQ